MKIACPFLYGQEKEGFICHQHVNSDLNRPFNNWDINEEVLKKYCNDPDNFIGCPRYRYAVAGLYKK